MSKRRPKARPDTFRADWKTVPPTARKVGKPKRTAVARAVPSPDTQTITVVGDKFNKGDIIRIDPNGVTAVTPVPPTVFVVMGHRNGSHGVVGLYLSRDRAQQEVDALIAKGNKHSREYTFTIDERRMYI